MCNAGATQPARKYVPPHLRAQERSPSVPPAVGASSPMPGAFTRTPSNSSFAGRPSKPPSSLPPRTRRPDGYGKWLDGIHIPAPRNERLELDLFGEPGDPFKQSTGINFDKYADIPVEAKGHNVPEPIIEFTNPPIDPHLLENIKFARYTTPTPVQKYSVPIIGQGCDLMACAQTGSGKTGGFLFPILSECFKNGPVQTPPANPSKYSTKVYPTALILAPTRELVNQIHEEAKKFAYRSWVKPAVVYGGAPSGEQMRQLDRGCDLLSAAPGRLCDFIDRGKISLANVKYLVLDEADRMLDMGFEPQIRRIVQGCDMPSVEDRQTLLFSATFPREIQLLAGDFLKNEIFLSVGRVGSTSENITQTVEWAEDFEKKSVLLDILEGHMEPESNNRTLIFVETKRMADILCDFLLQNNLRATAIHGDRDQREREYALNTFKMGYNPLMVATAVAARGLDIPHVSLVVNYDLPSDIDDYVHRIGRTGRAGNTGHAISFFNQNNLNIVRGLVEILREAKQEIPIFLEQSLQQASVFGGRGRGRGGSRGRGMSSRGGGSGFGSPFRRTASSWDSPSNSTSFSHDSPAYWIQKS
ncbi:DEAD-domain-containing protein [Wallemia mellicola]|uniref:ATP-dependent RNA helicase DED1 n=1 Tax=Wallemia mellicola TaxID=1708541 RepID=A0A4T0U7S6_9BASI|nr:DEAD-domain-containing protein [Wallemia mellicola]TIC00659.1 DEAD-domain-containing protein [Wallemia mellicola]TIC02530.1 DEAD-domain-containing protein [Wallemia mellicola]TIC12378.1 DEAD-domain-containing protein [Wallemia mellicola]TIC28362.1 DEAD-domain-containing protein [Wallemia mellicola]